MWSWARDASSQNFCSSLCNAGAAMPTASVRNPLMTRVRKPNFKGLRPNGDTVAHVTKMPGRGLVQEHPGVCYDPVFPPSFSPSVLWEGPALRSSMWASEGLRLCHTWDLMSHTEHQSVLMGGCFAVRRASYTGVIVFHSLEQRGTLFQVFRASLPWTDAVIPFVMVNFMSACLGKGLPR